MRVAEYVLFYFVPEAECWPRTPAVSPACFWPPRPSTLVRTLSAQPLSASSRPSPLCHIVLAVTRVCPVLALLPTRELPDAEAARPLTRPLLPAPRSHHRHASAVTRPGMRPLLCPHTRPSGHCHAAAPPTTHAHPPVAGSDLLIHPPQPRVFFGGLSLPCPPGSPPARWRASMSPSVLR